MNSGFAPINARDRLIVALDVPTESAALKLVQQLADQVGSFKIGLQLYTAIGPRVVEAVLNSGARVFLDLKLHDIPNTVGSAVASASQLGVHMLTLHLSGGRAMIEAAAAAKGANLLLLGVTVLTSLNDEMLRETGVAANVREQVLQLAQLGAAAGVDGVVASPHEISAIRGRFGQALKIVTPGVRPQWSEAGDQKRFSTPRQAIDAGADYLVIGRPIAADPEPAEAARRVLEELTA